MAYDETLGFDPDEKWEGYSRDGKEFLRRRALAQRTVAEGASSTATEDGLITLTIALRKHSSLSSRRPPFWKRICARNLRKELRAEMKEKVEAKPKVIIFDPSSALEKQIRNSRPIYAQSLTRFAARST